MFQALARRLLYLGLLLLTSAPAQANDPVVHLEQIYSVYQGSTAQATVYQGFLPAGTGSAAYPGVLRINPPDYTWSNFVRAAQETPKVDYIIANVTLQKHTPEVILFPDLFPASHVIQEGSYNIRLIWPLLYEVPGTTWTLTIMYATAQPYDDDGDLGHNSLSYMHTEIWAYYLEADTNSMLSLVELFHTMPFGTTGVPLISDELLYTQLRQYILAAQAAFSMGDIATAACYLADFELEVMDSVIAAAPAFPNSDGPGTGIANTPENPAACKILMDVEYIFAHTGFGSEP